MWTSYKNRECGPGMRVFVYYNLHQHCFSLKALEGPHKGKVIAHASAVMLESCTFKVSEKGRQKVLSTRVKNVHAGIMGTIGQGSQGTNLLAEVIYNPYVNEQFVHKESKKTIETASHVWLEHKKVYLI